MGGRARSEGAPSTRRARRRTSGPSTAPSGGEAVYFDSPKAFRQWLADHHGSASALTVGFHKKHTRRPTLTWPESVDEALCFGWIDGVRHRVDQDRYTIRFTPRKATSSWSLVNIRRVEALTREGRMQPAGLRAYAARREDRSGVYSFERQRDAVLPPDGQQRFRSHPAAWKFFEAQPPGYRRTAIAWVLSARREDTRLRRLEMLIADSANARRVGPLRRR